MSEYQPGAVAVNEALNGVPDGLSAVISREIMLRLRGRRLYFPRRGRVRDRRSIVEYALTLIEAGTSIRKAGRVVGVPESTLRGWLKAMRSR